MFEFGVEGVDGPDGLVGFEEVDEPVPEGVDPVPEVDPVLPVPEEVLPVPEEVDGVLVGIEVGVVDEQPIPNQIRESRERSAVRSSCRIIKLAPHEKFTGISFEVYSRNKSMQMKFTRLLEDCRPLSVLQEEMPPLQSIFIQLPRTKGIGKGSTSFRFGHISCREIV